jgi:hypothetical protein
LQCQNCRRTQTESSDTQKRKACASRSSDRLPASDPR